MSPCALPQVVTVLSSTKEFKEKHGQREFELYRTYQKHVHNDIVGGISEFYNFLVDSPLKVKIITKNGSRMRI